MGIFNSNYNVFQNTKISFLIKLQCNTHQINQIVNSFVVHLCLSIPSLWTKCSMIFWLVNH